MVLSHAVGFSPERGGQGKGNGRGSRESRETRIPCLWWGYPRQVLLRGSVMDGDPPAGYFGNVGRDVLAASGRAKASVAG